MVYQRLLDEQFFANPEKCTFAYCGFIVCKDGVRSQPEKLAVVHALQIPRDAVDVRSFLGMCGFYQRFVENYAKIAAPLTSLLRNNLP